MIFSVLTEMGAPHECHFEEVCAVVKKRLRYLEQVKAENETAAAKYREQLVQYQNAIAPAQSISDKINLLSRYEKHINKRLEQALNRLEAMKKSHGLLGSFGKRGS